MFHTCLARPGSIAVAGGHAPRPRAPIVKKVTSQSATSKPLRRPLSRALRRLAAASPESEPQTTTQELSGVVFEPFSEARVVLATVDKTDSAVESFARSDYAAECEAALNEQINVEYTVSYLYHALYAYFDRDNVGLPGMAEYFKEMSEEEREHAEKCMEYQNKRGGRVKLRTMAAPESEFFHAEKGEALYAMELALALEKMNYRKLRDLWEVADKYNDPQMCDFVESELLGSQVDSIKEVSVYVSQLRRVGLGHGVFHFDRVFHNGAN